LPAYRWHHAVIARRDHPIASAAPLTLAELARYPLVTYDPGYTGRSRIDEAFDREGLTPDFTLTALDADVIKTYVEQGMGVGIVASMAIDPKRDLGLAALDASHLFSANITRIAVRRGAYLRSYTYRFIELLAPHLDQGVVTDALDGILPSDEDLLADERASAAGAFANAESFVRAGAVSA
jgi:DNA-binding transcriptional LysR family regulator